MGGLRVSATGTGVRLSIRVQPRASDSRIAGVHGDSLKVRLTAPPVDGAANAALIELLAEVLGVSRQLVQIAAGQHSRNKVVEVAGLSVESVQRLVTRAATR